MGMASVIERVSRSAFVTRKSMRQFLRYGLSPTGADRHVFVAGVQRSGTNMVMEVLERSGETMVLHESDARAFSNYVMRDRNVIRRLAGSSRAPCFVIKALCESQEVLELMDDFSPAKTVWVFRHPYDVVNSMLRSFKEHAVHINRIAADRDSAGWRGRGMSDETHRLIRDFAHPDLGNENGAALMWYLRNALYFDRKLDRDPRVILVSYETLVTIPREEFGRLFEFLELQYSPRLSSLVAASSIAMRPAPVIRPEVQNLCESMFDRLVRERKRQAIRQRGE